MSYIEKRLRADGSTSYRARVKYQGRVLCSTHREYAAAKRWAAERGAQIRDDAHFAGEANRRRPLAELIDRYVTNVLPQKGDQRNPTRQLTWWKQRLGTLPVHEITRARIAELRDILLATGLDGRRARGPATIVRYLAALSHVFTIAMNDWGWAETNPVKGVRRPKEPRGRDRYLDEDERQRLLDACRSSASQDLLAFVETALCTGMRRGEIATLEWRDIDFARAQITLRNTKNGTRRGIPLCSPALDTLRARSKVRRLGTALVFPGTNPTKPIDLRTPWETALRRAQIGGFRFHDPRHSAASYLAMSGATPLAIAAILGHKSLQMTKRYAHLSVEHLRGVMDRAIEGAHHHG